MTQLMKTKIRKIDWFFICLAASLWGAKIWAPLGLIFSVPTVVLAVKSRKLHPRRVVASAILVAVMLLMTGGYIGSRISTHAPFGMPPPIPTAKTLVPHPKAFVRAVSTST